MRTRWLIAGVLIAVGLVWIGQGTGLIQGASAMTDDIKWAIIGAGLVIVGGAIAAHGVIARRGA